ncbi:serine hydrolase domain-containing protein [Parapedobacter sp. 10938]|uniref:serine hydrolase domain-containing protein n=1 Tax=Parapedobacter flavus TaxID=3110225 RepID=UPI002DBEB860|nr:serine hydrolase [Parapedobacter sp. 10938]MEC3878449.1 serine hydrolase [Parapedobacter sp. 10938]
MKITFFRRSHCRPFSLALVAWVVVLVFNSSCSSTQKVHFPTSNWVANEQVSAKTDSSVLRQIDSIMQKAHANGILIRDGFVVGEWTYDKPLETKIEVQSITKSVVSLLLGIALDEKKIANINDKVYTYFPAFDVGPYTKDITFKHLVTVSSGIEAKKHGYNYGNPGNMQPGVEARYHNDHFDQLARALTYIFDESLLDVLKSRVLAVLGAEVEWRADGEVVSKSGARIPVNAGYAFIKWSAPDLAKFGYLYLNNGSWNGKQLVSKEYVKATMTPIDIPLMVSRPNQPVREDVNNTYGYGWRGIKRNDGVLWYASGNGGQFCAVIPEKRTVFVKINGYGEKYRPFRGLSVFKDLLQKL